MSWGFECDGDGLYERIVMVLRFCATQLPWPLTLVIPILPSSIFHLPSSILYIF
jgi:hypothetical protein